MKQFKCSARASVSYASQRAKSVSFEDGSSADEDDDEDGWVAGWRFCEGGRC